MKPAICPKAPVNRDLIGHWISCDELGSNVKHQISISRGKYKVTCIDTSDNEIGEVYDVKWDGEKLHYCVYWASTGRFAKNTMVQQAMNQVELTYTYTDSEILKRIPFPNPEE